MQCPTCRIENSTGATTCSACGTPLSNTTTAPLNITLPQGSSLQNGAFKVGVVLGQGGFGITYKGGDMKLKRYVAIKEFFPQGSVRNTTQVQPTGSMTQANFNEGKVKFIEEARTLAKFNHPNIVRVFDAFEDNNTAYMAMELLNGHSIQSILDKRGALSEKAAVSIVNQIGKALFIVHQAGLLHRDIKPDNIIWTKDKRAVLIDFGTARAFTADKTSSMTAMVTQGYAPPEQYSSQAKFGSYTDIYALAATLYHCLTGQLPVTAMDRLNGVKLQSPREINPKISESVSAAVMEAMKLKAADRPQSVQDFLDMLKGKGLPQTTATVSQPTTPRPNYIPPATTPSGPPPIASSRIPPIQSPCEWHYTRHGQRMGPVSEHNITRMISQRQISPETLVWTDGMTDWQQASQTELGKYFPKSNPADMSGLGENSSPLPDELKGFNVGACFLSWIWGIGHQAWITLLVLVASFIPGINFAVLPMCIYFGFAGNELAWKNRKWRSVEEFKNVQKIWAYWGVGLFIVSFFIGSMWAMALLAEY